MNKSFEERLRELNESDSVDHDIPHFLSIFRHVCPKAGKSLAIDTKEIYWLSSDGIEAYVFREGKCPKCGQRGRSSVGKAVDPQKRPPIHGRVARS